ncbi:hypothetical protein P4H27_09050 [Paenibacillus taichungensis]|uniref:hypothetical protein n=1 Tax=Paenibacillus taichungensis TaxID=484184 RepID=UPI002DBD4B9C|nr:hypothetical protein [Paenibacillus taichungensis]MEC0107081.1 hypothetical protein [Paenibacillus taichungensis]MEC0194987.1 hypothetical protein [Paenibacillus taichungensis]
MTDLKAYHYFEKNVGPFRNLSSLSEQDAEAVAQHIRQGGRNFASQRSADYMMIRRELERKAYEQFISKGGKPTNRYPHYMTLGACAWLESWYTEPDWVTISWENIPADSVSFTYGDLFPTMRYMDDKPYRKQVYTKDEILDIIQSYGWPQEWNQQGDLGPERYIEVQVWNEGIIGPYRHLD